MLYLLIFRVIIPKNTHMLSKGAKALGITQQSYSRYERGGNELGYDALIGEQDNFLRALEHDQQAL